MNTENKRDLEKLMDLLYSLVDKELNKQDYLSENVLKGLELLMTYEKEKN